MHRAPAGSTADSRASPVSLLGAAEARAQGATEIPVSGSFSSSISLLPPPSPPSLILGAFALSYHFALPRLHDSEFNHFRKDRAHCLSLTGCCPFKINVLLREREERGPSLLPLIPEIKAILSSKIHLALGGTCVSLLPAPKGFAHCNPSLHAETNGVKEN